jgi:MFS family permease
VRSSHALTVLIGIFTITSLGEGVFGTMFVVWVKSVLHGSALQFGWFMSAQAVGGILGGLVIGAIGSRIVSNRLAWAGFLLFALLDITLFNYPRVSPQIWIGLVVMVLVGIPAAGGSSGYMTLLQTAIPDVYRGRVFGALGTTSALTQLIGTAIAGTLGSIVGPMARGADA